MRVPGSGVALWTSTEGVVITPCARCGRLLCRAEQLVRASQLLGAPEHMRLKVTTAQDECDHHRQRGERSDHRRVR